MAAIYLAFRSQFCVDGMTTAEENLCPICFDSFNSDPHFAYDFCRHQLHYKCILVSYPLPCPICRHGFTTNDQITVEKLISYYSRRGPPDSPQRPQIPLGLSNASSRPQQAPTYLLPLCCRHIGPPPSFAPLEMRGMRYHAEAVGPFDIYEDTWQCASCYKIVRANDFPQMERLFCNVHGPMAHVFDTHLCSYVGPACCVNYGTYLHPISTVVCNPAGDIVIPVDTPSQADDIDLTQEGPFSGSSAPMQIDDGAANTVGVPGDIELGGWDPPAQPTQHGYTPPESSTQGGNATDGSDSLGSWGYSQEIQATQRDSDMTDDNIPLACHVEDKDNEELLPPGAETPLVVGDMSVELGLIQEIVNDNNSEDELFEDIAKIVTSWD